jgi:hypothetical protein
MNKLKERHIPNPHTNGFSIGIIYCFALSETSASLLEQMMGNYTFLEPGNSI